MSEYYGYNTSSSCTIFYSEEFDTYYGPPEKPPKKAKVIKRERKEVVLFDLKELVLE